MSGILQPGCLAKSRQECGPTGALFRKLFPARWGEPVVAAPVLARLFDPPADDPPLSFQTIEDRVERGWLETHGTTGTTFDLAGDFIPVAGAHLDLRKDEEFGAAIFPCTIYRQHIFWPNISHPRLVCQLIDEPTAQRLLKRRDFGGSHDVHSAWLSSC